MKVRGGQIAIYLPLTGRVFRGIGLVVSQRSILEVGVSAESLPMRYVRLALFAQQSGYSEKAIRRKIEDGIWVQGREYRKAPDGAILIDVEGYERWVEGNQAAA